MRRLSQMPPCPSSFRERLRLFSYGICMGTSDLVPGVSGGTMAFILGIYENLIEALKSFGTADAFSLFRLDFKRFHKGVAWDYLLTLLLGIAAAFILFSHFIQSLLGHEVYRIYLYALFFGMVLSSALLCLKRIERWNSRLRIGCLLGAVATLFITQFQTETTLEEKPFEVVISREKIAFNGKEAANYDSTEERLKGIDAVTLAAMWAKGDVNGETAVYDASLKKQGFVADFVKPQSPSWIRPWLMFCGLLGISAMLLPGISGSYVLMILGVYPVVIGALVDLVRGWGALQWDGDAVVILGNLAVGIVGGALLFSQVISWLLRKDHDMTVALLVGCMGGAIQVIWPFWTYAWVINPLKLSKGAELQTLHPYLPSIWGGSFGEGSAWAALLFGVGGFVLVYAMAIIPQSSSKFEF